MSPPDRDDAPPPRGGDRFTRTAVIAFAILEAVIIAAMLLSMRRR